MCFVFCVCRCLSCAVCLLLFVVCCLAISCLLFVVCCLRCFLDAVCCMPFVVCCVLIGDCLSVFGLSVSVVLMFAV